MADLKIIISDENGYVMDQIQVYQDGSDSEVTADIINYIENKYETEDVFENLVREALVDENPPS